MKKHAIHANCHTSLFCARRRVTSGHRIRNDGFPSTPVMWDRYLRNPQCIMVFIKLLYLTSLRGESFLRLDAVADCTAHNIARRAYAGCARHSQP
eukprot:1854799-Pleurochrysis_carterae.AAC.1